MGKENLGTVDRAQRAALSAGLLRLVQALDAGEVQAAGFLAVHLVQVAGQLAQRNGAAGRQRRFSGEAEILAPASARKKIAEMIASMADKYSS